MLGWVPPICELVYVLDRIHQGELNLFVFAAAGKPVAGRSLMTDK